MVPATKSTIALVWTQFIPAHVDRCLAVARQLDGQVAVRAVEVASTSRDYGAFPATAALSGVDHRLLFPGQALERVPRWRRTVALLRALLGTRFVCIGIPYSQLETLLVAVLLRLTGSRVYLVYDSKFDDKPRTAALEWLKRMGLLCYSGAIVAGPRSRAYLRMLGFRRRVLLGGADSLALDRIRADAGLAASGPDFAERDFLFVGRFVAVKNIDLLLRAFAGYLAVRPDSRRNLLLVGAGPLEAALRQQASQLGLARRIQFVGFKTGAELAGAYARALALVVPSKREPWGFVVNEALAVELPVIASKAVGACDLLVCDGVNGYVVETGSVTALSEAMVRIDASETQWQAMRSAARERAWFADVERFVDAVELLHDPAAQPAGERMARCLEAFEEVDLRRSSALLAGDPANA